MQENRSNKAFIQDPVKFYEMLMNGENIISSWALMNEDTVQLVYKKEESFVESNPTTNVVLAASVFRSYCC
jgi:hypothetical protein